MTGQTFKTVDVLRLEVEQDPPALPNLVVNPSGEFGAWGYLTDVANTNLVTGVAGGLPHLQFQHNAATGIASQVYTEYHPITAGEWAAARFDIVTIAGTTYYVRARIDWFDASKVYLSSSAWTGYLSTTAAATHYIAGVQAPATTAFMHLRIDFHSTNTGTNPVNGSAFNFRNVMVTKAATSGGIGTSRINLATNPSLETGISGWTVTDATITQSSTVAFAGTQSLRVETSTKWSKEAQSPEYAVTGGTTYTWSAYFRGSVARGVRLYAAWFNAGTLLGNTAAATGTVTTSGWTRVSGSATTPSNATHVRFRWGMVSPDSVAAGEFYYMDGLLLEQGLTLRPYFDGSTAAGGGKTYAWSGPAHASSSIETSDATAWAFVDPVTYENILGPTHEIHVTRESLNVGSLTATVLDPLLDPSVDDQLRPGRRVRLRVYADLALGSSPSWHTLFTGTLTAADVSYLKDKTPGAEVRPRIHLEAVDAVSTLANRGQAYGVATVAELPYILEGMGVPWNVDGSGNQVAAATVTGVNESASVLDQVAITRDTVHGVAYVNRDGVLTALSAKPTAHHGSLTDEPGGGGAIIPNYYSEIDVSYSTKELINTVTVKRLEAGGEVAYGPYGDQASIQEWGTASAEFTVHASVDPATFAAEVLAANAAPEIRANHAVIPIADVGHLAGIVWGDLYSKIEVTYGTILDDQPVLISAIEHSITPEKWLTSWTFEGTESVASPTMTPSPILGSSAATDGTDQSARIQAELNSLAAAGGGRLTLPAGEIRANIVLPALVELVGAGVDKTILKSVAGSNLDVIKGIDFDTLTGKTYAAGDVSLGCYQAAVRSMTVDGDKGTTTAGYGIRLWGRSLSFTDLAVQNCSQAGIWTEYTTHPDGSPSSLLEGHFDRIKTSNNEGDGWRFRGPHDSMIDNFNPVNNAGWGFKSESTLTSYRASIYGTNWNGWLNGTGCFYFGDAFHVINSAATGAAGWQIETAADTGGGTFKGMVAGPNGVLVRGVHKIIDIIATNIAGTAVQMGVASVGESCGNCKVTIVGSGVGVAIDEQLVTQPNLYEARVACTTIWQAVTASAGSYFNLVQIGGASTTKVAFPGTQVEVRGYFPIWPQSNGIMLTWDSDSTGVGAAGGASALPATPLGYVRVKTAAGVAVSIPYYNT